MKRLSTICIFLATLLLPLQVSLAQPRRLSADFPKWAGVADTPQMGWSSWNCFMTDINEDLIKATADAMVITKMTAAPRLMEAFICLLTPRKEQMPRNWLRTTLLTSAQLTIMIIRDVMP